MIDTHCHLSFKAFAGKVKKTIKQAKKAEVEKIIVPGTNLETSKKSVELAKKYNGVYAAVGIHPYHALEEAKKLEIKKLRKKLEKIAKNRQTVAIGECGLDYHNIENQKLKIKNTNQISKIKKIQKEVFIMQIKLAQKLNLPLIIHSRQASNDILTLIENCLPADDAGKLKFENLRGVFHCFQGNFNLLNWALKNNFYIGITGIVTWDGLMQKVAKKTPLKKLLIETDSPFLVPEPLKSKKNFPNKPKNVKIIARQIAILKKIPLVKVLAQTTINAIKLFSLNDK